MSAPSDNDLDRADRGIVWSRGYRAGVTDTATEAHTLVMGAFAAALVAGAPPEFRAELRRLADEMLTLSVKEREG